MISPSEKICAEKAAHNLASASAAIAKASYALRAIPPAVLTEIGLRHDLAAHLTAMNNQVGDQRRAIESSIGIHSIEVPK